jgi:zinc D-Ala-D-Ala dipeptidase
MKLSKKLFVTASTVVLITLQSCGLTGNDASKTTPQLVIIADENSYLIDIQKDSNNRIVSLTNYLQPLLTDFRYATQQNFTKKALYRNPGAFLRLPAARALQAVQNELKQQHLGLKLFDAYRPYSVTVEMWKIVPDDRYAANPAKGSGHNRGIAVDLTLVDLATEKELPMPSGFDDFSERAHHDYIPGDTALATNRKLLRTMMEKHGFIALETEWWHYYLPDAAKYHLMDLDFEQLRKLEKNN